MRETINKVFADMTKSTDNETWNEKTERYFKVNYVPKGYSYALQREIGLKEDYPHGMSVDEIKKMLKGAGKNSSAYLVEMKIKRII